jgi:phosphoribosylamine--glycine ligase
MKILIVGGGGREHALAWKTAQADDVTTVFCAPGNAGTALEPKVRNVDIGAQDISKLREFAQAQDVALTIIGPEAPLVDGIVDAFQDAGLKCFGPRRDAAVLEGSKAFTKDFLKRYAIPTAAYETFTEIEPALAYLDGQPMPIVIKADGLAAGKGVVIARDHDQARDAVRSMLSGDAFGGAGRRIVIEEFMRGEEASFIVMTDGEIIIPFASSQDHKARDDGDKGPNTGGMGAYSPAPIVDAPMHRRIIENVIRPTLAGMANEGRHYQGFLYAGIMITPAGETKVLEFNCRFGDPETQPIMMRLQSDLAGACLAVVEGRAGELSLDWDQRAAVGVVLASRGYPGSYEKGYPINGLDIPEQAATKVFHAGTSLENGGVVSNGGRVLCVVGLGDNVRDAQAAAYRRVDRINWEGMFYRRDIGYRAIARELA